MAFGSDEVTAAQEDSSVAIATSPMIGDCFCASRSHRPPRPRRISGQRRFPAGAYPAVVNLIILDPGELGAAGSVRLRGPRAAHVLNVLRVKPGHTLSVGVLNGARGTATVRSAAEGVVELSCRLDAAAPSRPRVDLLLAVPRPKVMRRLWAQITALGVFRIILTNAERVERPYFDTHILTPEFYRPLLIEGLQQARDTLLPSVSIHRRFKVLIEDDLDSLCGTGLRIVGDPGVTTSVSEVVRHRLGPDPCARLLLAVGPEGGWNNFELRLLATHGFHRVGMGPRTLRTDTASLALLALVHDAILRPAGAPPGALSAGA